MPLGLLGKKLGQTRVYDATGVATSVTIVLAGPNRVLQVKTQASKDGYNAVQLGFDDQKEQRVTKPLLGHIKKQGGVAVKRIKEFRNFSKEVKPGEVVGATLFAPGDFIDAIGVTKGRGFEGVMKRHHFRGGEGSHGSMFHRAPGSIGASSYPSRVVKGMRAGGRMGGARTTIHNLKVLRVDAENNLLVVEGGIPGAPTGYVVIRKATTAKKIKVAQVEKPKKGKK